MEQTTLAGQAPAETVRSPLEWLGLVAPAVALVVAIVFLSNTDWYSVFKAIHVVSAVLWVGGGAAITILALKAQRTKDDAGLVQIAKQAEYLAMRLFVPASLVVGVMGFVLMHKGQWGYDHFWSLFALAGWIASFVVGMAFLGPETGRLAKLMDEKGPDHPETIARVNRIVAVARTDVVLIALIAADMVAKPFS